MNTGRPRTICEVLNGLMEQGRKDERKEKDWTKIRTELDVRS